MIIGFCGRKRVGKNLAGAIIQAIDPSFRCIAFADELKRECASVLGIFPAVLETDKERYRPFLQWYGTEYRRHDNPNYWIDKVAESVKGTPGNYCITDARFQNEVDWIRSVGGVVVGISGEVSLDSTIHHTSETSVDSIVCDYSIVNCGTPNYAVEVRKVYDKIMRQGVSAGSGGASHIALGLMQAERLQEK